MSLFGIRTSKRLSQQPITIIKSTSTFLKANRFMARLITHSQMVTWFGMERPFSINKKVNISSAIHSDSFMEDTKPGLKLTIQSTWRLTEAHLPNQKPKLPQLQHKQRLSNFRLNWRESEKKETNSCQKSKSKLKTSQRITTVTNWLTVMNLWKNTCPQESLKVWDRSSTATGLRKLLWRIPPNNWLKRKSSK